jgi:hypothetical protein
MRRTAAAIVGVAILFALSARPAPAQTYDAGSTGANGAFTLPNAACPSGTWCGIDLPPSGELHYTTFTVPCCWNVWFKRNASNTPVIIRASGNVTIAGNLQLGGANGVDGSQTMTSLGNTGGAGGPGGFDGGSGANGIVSTTGGTGGGPGGGAGGVMTVDLQGRGGGGAGFGVAGVSAPGGGGAAGGAYGTTTLIPSIGGSGGGGGGADFGRSGGGGGGGGGAIVIASSGTISVTGNILAKGGNGGWMGTCCPGAGAGGAGSGGSIRLAATTVSGSGTLNVAPGTAPTGTGGSGVGSIGRIRVEAYNVSAVYNLVGTKASVVTTPNAVVLANAPSLSITGVAGIAPPAAPGGIMSRPDLTLPITTTNPVAINIAGTQIPLGTTVLVTVRGQNGIATSVTSSGLTGTLASSTTSVSLTVPTDQPSVISAVATFERVALGEGGPVYAEGEPITWVRVAASAGSPTRVTYITASGREVSATP